MTICDVGHMHPHGICDGHIHPHGICDVGHIHMVSEEHMHASMLTSASCYVALTNMLMPIDRLNIFHDLTMICG